VSEVSALAGERHGWFPKEHAQVRLKALRLNVRARRQRKTLAILVPGFGKGGYVDAGVLSDVLNEVVYMLFR
jgi:hypothetical protein